MVQIYTRVACAHLRASNICAWQLGSFSLLPPLFSMSGFSFHFFRPRRSPPLSSTPSPAVSWDDTAFPSSWGPDVNIFHPSFFRPSSRLKDMDTAPGASRLSIPGNTIHQISTRRPPLNRAPVNFGGQPSQASRPVTPIGAVPSSAISVLSQHHSVVQRDSQLTPPSDHTESFQAQQPPVPLPLPYMQVAASQQFFNPEPPIPPTGQDLAQQWQREKQGIFDQAHDFSITGSTFVDDNQGTIAVTNNINTISSKFMEKLLEKTIPGAASDSSARYPPPRCHPGTRLAILERCLYFIANCDGEQKIRWVFGAAGVGKSAIMQTVADSPNLPVTCHVSVFFSINGRDDGTKAIITLCYQLAAQSGPYRELIEHEVARDPSLLQSSMPVQFNKFIIEPFIHKFQLLNSPERILIIIDGLDECNNSRIQLVLLRLISDFCFKYPSSPIVWLVASRPERHITSFFDEPKVKLAYEKEEIQVDSDEGRADVEQFLRAELNGIKASSSLGPYSQWPEEKDFWKLAEAAGGLFAYADTAIKYIGDLNTGNPVLQLSDVLKVIDNHPMTGIPREEHPLALLDALYARILSNIPAKVILHARKLVLALASGWDEALGVNDRGNFVTLCNWLAMTPDEAYAAVNQLQSLLRTPRRDTAHLERLEPFHKSFLDYVSDSSRSNFFTDMDHEAQQLKTECAFRVLNEAPDGISFRYVIYKFRFGTLRRGPGTGNKISLTWPVDGCDKDTRLKVYKVAIGAVAEGLGIRDSTLTSEFYIRLLITRFQKYEMFDYDMLRELVFDESRRPEFMACGILKQLPLKAVTGIPMLRSDMKLSFRRPSRAELPSLCLTRAVTSLVDPWNPSCEHEREGEWEEGNDQDWKTTFQKSWQSECSFCRGRFDRQFKNLKTHHPDRIVQVLFTSAGDCCVELQFVDPYDGISEWTYWFWIELSPAARKEYGSTV